MSFKVEAARQCVHELVHSNVFSGVVVGVLVVRHISQTTDFQKHCKKFVMLCYGYSNPSTSVEELARINLG